MSNLALRLVKPIRCDGGKSAKSVLRHLADYANRDFEAYPAVSKMAAELNMADRTVQRAIASLVKQGLIQRELRQAPNGRQTTSIYRLMLGTDAHPPSSFLYPNASPASPSPGHQGPRQVGANTSLNHQIDPESEFSLSPSRSPNQKARKISDPHFERITDLWIANMPDRFDRGRAQSAWQDA